MPKKNTPTGSTSPQPPPAADKVESTQAEVRKQGSLAWLWHNVDYKFWTFWGGTLIAAFSLGLGVGHPAWFQYLTGKEATPSLSKSISENDNKKANTSSTPTTTASEVAGASSEFIRERSANELANYFAGIPPLQQKALFESSYLGRRVNWKGKVFSVIDSESEFRVDVFGEKWPDQYAVITLSFPKEWRLRIEQLRVGDRVSFEGEIKNSSDYIRFAVAVDKLTTELPPSPTPTSKKSRR